MRPSYEPLRGYLIPIVLAALAFPGISLFGCGRNTASLHVVSGSVTLDGVALENGVIRFSPIGSTTPVGGTIEAGKFTIMAPEGQFRVEITSARVVGHRKAYDTPDSPMVAITEEAVPPRFNVQTTLQCEVTPGRNTMNFDLTTR